jgi:peroxiredoxin
VKSPGIWVAAAVATVFVAIFGYFMINESQKQDNIATKPADASPGSTGASKLFRLTLPDIDGKLQALEQWRGKILVVNYWATWCAPCREEMPGFARLQEKNAANGVQFIGISIDTAPKVAEFQTTTPVNYPLLIGDLGAIDSSIALGNSSQALPFTVVFDRQGKVVAVKLGRFAEADMERQLAKLVSRGP